MAIDTYYQTLFGNGTPRLLLGDAVPTGGTFYTGDIIQNSAPGAVFAWACTAGGSPGTWVAVTTGQSSAAVPSTGAHVLGEIVYASTPTDIFAWICTVAGTPGTWVPVALWNTGTVTPASGTFVVGDIVWNSAPAANAPVGWVCTVAGSPGTFVPMGFATNAALTTTATSGTLAVGYSMVLLNPASTGTYSLPNVTAYASGSELYLKNIASGSVTLTPLGANGYDAAAITLAQFASVTLRSAGGTTWYRQQ